MRILITGWPKTGKTTHAPSFGFPVRSTDDVLSEGLDWSAASAAIVPWFDLPGPWVIEGVAIPRALRKWRALNPDQPPPADRLYVYRTPYVELSAGQRSMGKGVETVLQELAEWLAPIRVFGVP